MKTILIRRAVIVSVAAIAAFTAGCASVAVSNNAIEQNTASALGLEKARSRFRIVSMMASSQAMPSKPTPAKNTVAM